MKYRLNKLPVKTTNGFKINDIEVDIDLPVIDSFKDFEIINGDRLELKKCIKEEKISSKIGLSFSKYLELDIVVPKNTKIENTVFINYNFLDNDNLIDKINIKYEDNSLCNFIIMYRSLGNGFNFHHLLERVEANSNSCGNITLINLLNDNSSNFMAIENECLDKSNIVHNIIDISGNLRINNIYSNVYNNAKNYVNNIYIGKGNEIIDMNYYLNNIGSKSLNNMVVEGVLNDNSIKNFRGTIDFLKGSLDAIGEENENCVLLSDNARSRSLPQMLCHEENVVGSHGVSSGKIDDLKLFYIMSRGLSKKDAERLIVMSNFLNIINKIPDKKVIEEIQNIVECKLS